MQNNINLLVEKSGFIRDGKPNAAKLAEASVTELLEFCAEFAEITSFKNIKPVRSIYSHAASEALGGGKRPCRSYDCRSNRVAELIQFASLYSDRVYINNFLWDLMTGPERGMSKEDIVSDFSTDIAVLSRLLPLIQLGRVIPVTFQPICPHCLTELALRQSPNTDYDKACKDLKKLYYKDVEYSILYRDGQYALQVIGPESLLPHGVRYMTLNIRSLPKMLPSVVQKVQATGTVRLTKKQADNGCRRRNC